MSASKPRLYLLDGLRGICAFLIMGYHYINWSTGHDIFQVGSFGVYVFFILSGFSLWYVYADMSVTAASVRAFFVSRFARIFPLYLLVHLKFVGHGLNLIYLKRFMLNVTFLFGVTDPGLTSGVTGGWSIGIEWVFYLGFPLLWVCLRDLRTILAFLMFALIMNQVFVGGLFMQVTQAQAWGDYVQFPVFIVYFAAGILCADLFARIQPRMPQGLNSVQQGLARLGIIACLMVVFMYPSATVEDYLWGWHFPLLILCSSGAVLLCSLVNNLSAMEIRICKFLGDVSFSAYLTHYLVYKYGYPFFTAYSPDMPLYYVLPILGCCTIAVAYLLYRFYEMPARRFINNRLGGHKA